MIEKIQRIVKNITIDTTLPTQEDGRTISALKEDELRDLILEEAYKQKIKAVKASARKWYDLYFEIDNVFVPVNIKITQGNAADNLSSKEGMYYALTGDQNAPNQWIAFHNKLFANLQEDINSDYYFIVYFKTTNKILVTSLMNIEYLTPNGNNLPFQCQWSNNIIATKRERKDQIKYILETYYTSWLKKSQPFEALSEKINEFRTGFYTK
jgi:hypothetical protein